MRSRYFHWVNGLFRGQPNVPRALVLLFIFAGVPLVLCELRLMKLRSQSCMTPGGKTIRPADFAELTKRLDRQKDQRSAWAYAALVGIVAVSVFKKVFDIPWLRPAYLLVGTAGVCLFSAIRAGELYEQCIAGTTLVKPVGQRAFEIANDCLWSQLIWLQCAAVALLLFVGVFLVAVVSGNVRKETERHAGN